MPKLPLASALLLGQIALFASIVRGQVVPVAADLERGTDELGGAFRYVVAVGVTKGFIHLAVPPPQATGRWRFRTLLLHPKDAEPRNVSLSKSGTKLVVETESGTPTVVDLTEALPEVGNSVRHRLPEQRFVLLKAGVLDVVDDGLEPTGRSFSTNAEIVKAVLDADETVFYATSEKKLFRCPPLRDCEALQAITERLRSAADFHLVEGQNLILRDEKGNYELVDRVSGLTRESYRSQNVAFLRASLLRSTGEPQVLARSNDGVLEGLVGRLEAQSREAAPPERGRARSARWSFFTVSPDPEIYAPILELAQEEPVFPSDIGIWKDLSKNLDVPPVTRAAERPEKVDEKAFQILDNAFFRAYRRLGDDRKTRCTIYHRATSYPGSWLIEYWIYYPFDVGGVAPHLHDPEHVFVEVSKLGGTVSAVVGSAHGPMTANNVYLTGKSLANPVKLPLMAITELRKHASAPDVNGDGVFTPGLDENFYKEAAKIWGVRDTFGGNYAHFSPYESAMAAPRQPANRIAVASARRYFPDAELPQGGCVCKLDSLGSIERSLSSGDLDENEKEAASKILQHRDALNHGAIFKKWLFPPSFFRLGIGGSRGGRMPAVGGAYVRDLPAVPGRLAFQLLVEPRADEMKSRVLDAGIVYERLLSNLMGYYAGFQKRAYVTSGESDSFEWQRGIWLSVGPLFEIPLGRTNFSARVGYAFKSGESPRFEWDVAFGVFQRDRWFWGIPEKQRSPY